MCSPGEYNLVGFAVGAVERGMKFPQQERIVDGDVLIGIASSGLHTQGFSLVRKIILMSPLQYCSSVSGGCGAQTLGITFSFKKKPFREKNRKFSKLKPHFPIYVCLVLIGFKFMAFFLTL